jgi:imidazolonepropionase
MRAENDKLRRHTACIVHHYVYTYSHLREVEKTMVGAAKASGKAVRIWRNARLATMSASLPGMGAIERGAVAVEGDTIVYAGPEGGLSIALAAQSEVIDCDGRLITPGLIDCHTHLVHAGNRANEFEMRLAGATYEEVARAGGGIVSSVKALRGATEDELVAQTLPRLDALMAEGVTTVEMKSGYGLDLENEAKSLRAARRLAGVRPVSVKTTFLGAHALPAEANGDKDAFIAKVADEILPAIAGEGLVDAVDGFCEGIAFSPTQIARVFDRAKELGLPVKLHADQLSNLHGAALAASYGALSADHLEYTDEDGAEAMAKAGTVAVILPGAFYFIRETKKPPVDLFRKHGVGMAVATDCNPGTSPLTSLLLTMNMAATLFGMTVDECLLGVTRNAAAALGLAAETGTLEVGKRADLAIWNVERPAELVYRMGFNPLHARIWRGA